MAQKKRVLVTGGAGFIGSVLVRLLLKSGYRVTVLDPLLYSTDSLRGLKPAVRIVRGDTRNTALVTSAMRGVDAIVHLAEVVGDPACSADPIRARAINLLGTQVVASAAKESGVRNFIYMSSCSVYGLTDGTRLFSEDDPLNPMSIYAELKIEAEQYISSLADDSFAPTILRLATVYGLSFRPRFDLLVNTLVARAVVDEQIVIQGKDNWRPFIHVADVARVVLAMLKRKHKGVETFNVGHVSQNYTFMDIANMVHAQIPTAALTVVDQADADKRSYRVDFSRLNATINFSPRHTIMSAIKELIKYLSVNNNYTSARYSNANSVEKRRMNNDPGKVVTMRTEKTEQKYRDAAVRKETDSTGCLLCAISEDRHFPKLKYWRIVRNQYPYDKVAEKSWLCMPRRCVSQWAQLTQEEQREYHEFRLIAGDYGVNFFMWSTPLTQSVPGHYHEHLLRLRRKK